MTEDIEQKNREAFSTRFNAILDRAGVDRKGKGRQEVVGKMFDVSGKAARKWLEGEGYPTFSKLILIVEKFKSTGVTIEWLLTGNGPKHPGDSTTIPQDISFENMIYIELKGIKEQLKAINAALIASLLDK